MTLPRCGLYRTTAPIGEIPEGRLVFFHNHGDPGPGIYLPESWHLNRARFAASGTSLLDERLAANLAPVPPEGLYRVEEQITCCPQACRTFVAGQLVQVGYNARAEPILFQPAWTAAGLTFPTVGQILDPERLAHLSLLHVADGDRSPPSEPEPHRPPGLLH